MIGIDTDNRLSSYSHVQEEGFFFVYDLIFASFIRDAHYVIPCSDIH